MVARAGRYFGYPFKRYRNVIQGYPLSPKIFNTVVNTVIRHWVALVASTKDGTEVLGLSIQDLVAYLYADDGLVTSTQTERLQRVFNVLTNLFDRVGLRTNMINMVSMACQPCHTPVRISSAAYERRRIGTGTNFRERHQRRVAFPQC